MVLHEYVKMNHIDILKRDENMLAYAMMGSLLICNYTLLWIITAYYLYAFKQKVHSSCRVIISTGIP